MEKSKSFLIDTHIFIWWMEKSTLLSEDIYQLIDNPQHQIFLSVASIWEMVIKNTTGKLKIQMDIEEGIKFSSFIPLPITLSHVLELKILPSYHNDFFDKIMIAQARVEKLTFVTEDVKIKKYDLKIVR